MAQTSRPVDDIEVGSWTPEPVFQQINELAPDCTTKVESSGTVPFAVKMAALVKPLPGGEQKLTVRLRSTDISPNIWAFISLFQENRLILTYTEMNPGTTFINVVLTLTQAQIQQITDYSKLSVQMKASPIPPPSSSSSSSSSSSGGGLPTNCCPGGLPDQLTATLNASAGCAAVDGESLTLNYSEGSSSWEGETTLGCGESIALRFSCAGFNCENFQLQCSFNCFDEQHIGFTGCTCNPLHAVFLVSDPYASSDCLCCDPDHPAGFNVTITQ